MTGTAAYVAAVARLWRAKKVGVRDQKSEIKHRRQLLRRASHDRKRIMKSSRSTEMCPARAPSTTREARILPSQTSSPAGKKSDQRPAAALARSLALHSDRKTFISALTATIRFATPLYFLVAPVTVLVTAPWWTRLCNFS